MVPILSYIALAASPCAVDITLEQARTIAAQYRDYAAKAGGSVIIGPAPAALSTNPYTAAEDYGCWGVLFDDGALITVRKTDGKVRSFGDSLATAFPGEWNQSGALSQAALLQFANNYYHAAGFTDNVEVRSKTQELADSMDPNHWRMHCRRRFGGVEFFIEHDAVIAVEHVNGRLGSMIVYPTPTPPASLTPVISANAARAAAANYLYQRRGLTSFQEVETMRPVIWVPKGLHPSLNELTPADNLLAQNFCGKLAYTSMWLPQNIIEAMGAFSMPEPEPVPTSNPYTYHVFIDAVTGSVLGSMEVEKFGAKPPKALSRTIDFSKLTGSMNVLHKNKTLHVRNAGVSATSAPPASAASVPVVFSTKRTLVVIDYYPKAGIIGCKVNGKSVYAKPNRALQDALKTVVK
jgi:hypothetical protein